MDKKRKNTRQIRVLISSIVLASVIVVGGTFAWFTSKDEVTNKLTATNNYGVTIKEDFTPPTNLVPGQNVTKDVSVVNTGNIEAFVNVQLSNYINVTTKSADTAIADIATKNDTLVELSTDEVVSAQAGGRLVYSGNSAVTDTATQNKDGTDFKPSTTGLYIFERNITPTTTDNSTTYTYEYSGYYYDSTSQKYYEISIPNNIVTRDANGDVTAVDVTGIKLMSTTTVENKTPELDYKNITADNPYIKATYCSNSSETDHANDIIFNIYLSETFTQDSTNQNIYTSEDWTFNSTTKTFYYNHLLMPSSESKKLVTSIELDDTVQKEAYTSLDYNLKVTSNSVQVVYDSDGSIVETGSTPDTTSLEALGTWKDTYNVDNSSTTLKSDNNNGYNIVWSFVTTT